MPGIKKGESQSHYVSRCIPIRKQEHPEESQKRSVAACYGMYRQKKKARGIRKK